MSIKVFNEIYFRRQSGRSRPFLAAPDAFFYPLDGIGNWNRMYGRRGFLQYQCVLPEGEALAGIQELLERIGRAGAASFLAVLKRLGQGSGGNLSFPLPGFTLALDLPHKGPETLRLVQELDREVLKRGGRVNLCKDACLAPESFRQMYPAFDRWLEVKKRVDPDWTLQSEMSRRLRLREGC
jgi:FAD/FMN-containing dehydrogenase